jgi:hypothetical protein
MEDLLLSVSSPPEIDLNIFSFWIEGRTADEASNFKIEHFRKSGISFGLEFPRMKDSQFNDQSEFLKYEVNDQYCLFQMLDHYLCQPPLLKTQNLCIVSADVQKLIIDKYWSLDDIFVREILNKKLSKNRKDLEDSSESTGLNLRRVTRQYENLKRVYSYFEETVHNIDNLYTFVSKQFLLNSQLSKKYACIIFLLYHKFNLTTKRRIQRLPCEK